MKLTVPAMFLITLLPLQVLSAQTSSPAAPAPGTRVYVPADFAQFAPQTALDMLNRVPGFTIRQEDLERGLGQATGNVLVNGQRISGKSNDVITALGRISARNVERIEIVDGSTLDIAGLAGQVANVIVRATDVSGQFGYYPEFRQQFTDPRFTRFEVSASGVAGPVEYTVGVDNRSGRSGAGGPTYIDDANGVRIEKRIEEWRGNSERPRLSGKFAFDAPDSAVANLNFSYTRLMFDYLEKGERTTVGQQPRDRVVTIDEEGDSYEIGGDYELSVGQGRLKLIALTNGSNVPSETSVLTTFHDGTPAVGSRYTGTGDEQEAIGRGEYRWKDGVAEWQVSAEAAFNRLDNASRLFSRNLDGTYTEVPLPGATARVGEDRYEVVGSYGRPIRSDMTMKLSAGAEYSSLSAGGTDGARTFYRPKGEVSLAWKVSPLLDVNAKLARRVGQLNFYDFLASVNLQDDTGTAANPDLVPQQSWELDVEGVRSLGARGSTTVRLYSRLIDDIIDYVPIGEDGEAPGNLDQATIYGIESRSTINLDTFGIAGARLDTSLQFEQSEVTDPLTGESRPISNNLMRSAEVNFRHDVPGTSVAWGADASYYYAAKNYRLTEVGRLWEGPVWGDVYIEHKNVRGLTIRAGLYNLFRADSMWDRVVYDGRRTGPVAFVERRDRVIGPIYSFSIRGKF